ncbi:MAG: insulinase family protein, partial [Candidatus Rokuibacteriota bacterium]
MRLRRLSAALVILAVLLALPAGAAKPIAHREVLPNGIVLLVAERPAVPIIVVRTFAHAGAVLDPPDRAGLANLTGAVLTRGTAKHTAPELDSAIEFVGGSLSAGAGRDGLGVSLAVLKKDLGLGLDLLAEVLLTPTFPPEEVKRKAAQIQAAIKRSEEDPGTVANRALARLVFPNHPYGRPVEGTIESVGKLTRDDVARFHGANVRPDTTIITVVGAITVDDARREVLARFGGWKAPAEPP